jgi:hypothetical protein
MTTQKIITASLEGSRIVVDEKFCELQEYNFVQNRWYAKDEALLPLPHARVEEWLSGWNKSDRFTAMNVLIAPPQTD